MNDLDLEALARLADVVSAVVVVMSLVYLAHQVRQNTASLHTENYARALERIATMQARLSSDGAFAELVSRGAADPARLSPGQRVQFTWAFYEMFGAFEFMFHQATSDALPEEVWNRWSETLSWWLSLPGVRTWWLSRPAAFSESFTSHVDSKLREGRTYTDTAQRWAAFIKTGTAPETAGLVEQGSRAGVGR